MKNKLTLLLLLLVSGNILANVTLPGVISDNMVLQRNSRVTLWGWADPKEEIKIKVGWSTQEFAVKAGNLATWSLEIPTPEAGGPFTISIKGYNEIALKNILIGEVWLCSGQSNMEMSASWGIDNGEEEVRNANHPGIRFFRVPKLTALTPQNDIPAAWTECTPETMKYASAVAYFFARRLREDLKDVPVGLIISAWGGTPAEVWMPEEAVRSDPAVLKSANSLKESEWCPHQPARAFNAMIAPLTRFRIAGTLWYQGESNVGSEVYDATLAALITSWRASRQQDFPFYYVQIAPYDYGKDHFGGGVIRDAQRKVLRTISNVGMVITSDISPTDDIHPKDKKSVGIRLANLALANTYKTYSRTVNGPLFNAVLRSKNKLIVKFDNAEEMYFKNKTSTLFELSGPDNIFYPAKASIKENQVILESDKVKSPVHVRFAWKNTDQSDLFNKAGLPASTFSD
jgi:sialate O-acetylesterase